MATFEKRGIAIPSSEQFDISQLLFWFGEAFAKPAGERPFNQFKKISALPDEEKTLVLKMFTAFIRDFNTQQAYASLVKCPGLDIGTNSMRWAISDIFVR